MIAQNGPLNGFYKHPHKKCKFLISYQFVIAQWSVWQLPTWEVLGSNPGKEDNLLISDKKGNLINLILNTIIVCVYELTGPV